jgi:hypothetical protein
LAKHLAMGGGHHRAMAGHEGPRLPEAKPGKAGALRRRVPRHLPRRGIAPYPTPNRFWRYTPSALWNFHFLSQSQIATLNCRSWPACLCTPAVLWGGHAAALVRLFVFQGLWPGEQSGPQVRPASRLDALPRHSEADRRALPGHGRQGAGRLPPSWGAGARAIAGEAASHGRPSQGRETRRLARLTADSWQAAAGDFSPLFPATSPVLICPETGFVRTGKTSPNPPKGTLRTNPPSKGGDLSSGVPTGSDKYLSRFVRFVRNGPRRRWPGT